MQHVHSHWEEATVQEKFQQILNEGDNLITQKQLQSLLLACSPRQEDQVLQLANQKELEGLLVDQKGHYQVKEFKQSYKKYYMKQESLSKYLTQELAYVHQTLGKNLSKVLDKIEETGELGYIQKDKLAGVLGSFGIETNLPLFCKS